MSNQEKRTSENDGPGVSQLFGDLANRTSLAAGRATTFCVAVGVVLVWAITGAIFGFSDTWHRHQYWYNDRHVPDGLSNSKFAKS